MTSLSVEDRNILIISGYVRRIEKVFSIRIPNDIKMVLNDLYKHCDSWNREYTYKLLSIIDNSQTVHGFELCEHYCCVYGDMLVQHGQNFCWELKVNGQINGMYVGIINNNKDVLNKYESSTWWWIDDGNGYLFNCKYKQFRYPEDTDPGIIYGDTWGSDGDTMKMIVDLRGKNSWIAFELNGKDYGVVYDKISKKITYRLSVCVYKGSKNAYIELL
eukprot:194681_1